MKDCIFCQIVRGEAESWKVYENELVYAFLCIYPATPYHTLIIPKKHYTNVFDTPDEELREIISVIKRLTSYFESKLGIKNVQIINSSGPEARQDVFHTHFHLLPRKIGDGQDVQWTTTVESKEKLDEIKDELKEVQNLN